MAKRDARYQTKGQIYIAEVSNTDTLLKNLSSTGMCIESTGLLDIIPNERYSVDIIPEKDSNVGPFSLEIESRWVRTRIKSSDSGFVIVIPPGTSGHTALEQYLSYLASQPENEEAENDQETEDLAIP